MPYLTLFLVVTSPLIAEWLLGTAVPNLWRHPRWVVLPIGTALLGWTVPMGILPAIPLVEHLVSLFLGLVCGLLVALLGHFRGTFWSGPDEREIAMTGRRSMYMRPRGTRPRG